MSKQITFPEPVAWFFHARQETKIHLPAVPSGVGCRFRTWRKLGCPRHIHSLDGTSHTTPTCGSWLNEFAFGDAMSHVTNPVKVLLNRSSSDSDPPRNQAKDSWSKIKPSPLQIKTLRGMLEDEPGDVHEPSCITPRSHRTPSSHMEGPWVVFFVPSQGLWSS